ncbi:MAG: HNH endonuclease [Nitrospirae bacterium]|nr:HNH endonuclease [Nitrospirota bacterium]
MPKRVQKRADNPRASSGFDCAYADGEVACVSEAFVKREKQKARLLRKTPWWKAKCSVGTCYYCNSSVPPSELTMDHIIPVSRGGMSIKSNVAVACKGCNDRKKHTLPFRWTEYMEGLGQPSGV